jgi:hypothetical protein
MKELAENKISPSFRAKLEIPSDSAFTGGTLIVLRYMETAYYQEVDKAGNPIIRFNPRTMEPIASDIVKARQFLGVESRFRDMLKILAKVDDKADHQQSEKPKVH